MDTEPIEVRIRDCACPNTPHDGDIVYLAPALSMAGGMAAKAVAMEAITEGRSQVWVQEQLADLWIRHGVIDWNLVDEDGDPIRLTPTTIAAALPYGKGGRLVAERADALYAEDIVGPLVQEFRSISRRGPTAGSTSRTRTPRTKSPRRSSTATTAREPRVA